MEEDKEMRPEYQLQLLEVRRVKGEQIADMGGQVQRVDSTHYRVHSQSGEAWYSVQFNGSAWSCECADFKFRELGQCKHTFAVSLSVALRNRIENSRRIEPLDIQSCLFCYSKNIVRRGILHNKSGDIQRFGCKDCGKRFVRNLGFEHLKASPKMVTGALQLYFSGESLRNTQKFLKLQGVDVSHQTIYNWITRYVKLMEGYLEQVTPQVSDTWRADELYLKVKGNMKYLFAMMDNDTRFWIAQQVADHKATSDIRPLLHASQEVAGKKPQTFISDGAQNFHDAYKKEYKTRYANSPVHISHIRLQGDHNNNRMERLNGELRDREKVMRSLKTVDSPILKGMQIFHNYFRPHMALDGKTPAEACGIKVEGENPWITLIQNATKSRGLQDGDVQ
jgi:transposase-like protein